MASASPAVSSFIARSVDDVPDCGARCILALSNSTSYFVILLLANTNGPLSDVRLNSMVSLRSPNPEPVSITTGDL